MVFSIAAMLLKEGSYNNYKLEGVYQMKIHRVGRFLLPIAAIGFLAATATVVRATPYASCITNNAGTIQFYLNESGGNITVTYEDSSVDPNYNGTTTGLNLASGIHSFALGT